MTPKELRCLVEARQLIENDETDFICVALSLVGAYDPTLKASCARLKSFIMNALTLNGHHYLTLVLWQRAQGMRFERDQHKQHRLDWLDWMIKGYYLDLYTKRSIYRLPQSFIDRLPKPQE